MNDFVNSPIITNSLDPVNYFHEKSLIMIFCLCLCAPVWLKFSSIHTPPLKTTAFQALMRFLSMVVASGLMQPKETSVAQPPQPPDDPQAHPVPRQKPSSSQVSPPSPAPSLASLEEEVSLARREAEELRLRLSAVQADLQSAEEDLLRIREQQAQQEATGRIREQQARESAQMKAPTNRYLHGM